MDQLGADRLLAVRELHLDRQHLRDQVPVGERAGPLGAALRGVDPDPDRTDVRLEPDRLLDRPGESLRGSLPDGGAEVLVENAPELDARLEEQRLALGERRSVEPGRTVGHSDPWGAVSEGTGGTVNGPTK